MKTDNIIGEMIKLVPFVIESMSAERYVYELLQFFKLVSESKISMKNIALQSWMEVVKWLSIESTNEMRYSENTKKFWKLGYRLFGGQFLYFMTGSKSRNVVVTDEAERGIYISSCKVRDQLCRARERHSNVLLSI